MANLIVGDLLKPVRFTYSLSLALGIVGCTNVGVEQAVPAAEVAEVTGLSGTWRHVVDAQAQKQRYAAIDQATEDMSNLFRGVARNKLRTTTNPAQVLTIVEDSTLVKLSNGEGSVTAPTDGTSKEISVDGGKAQIQATRRNGNLTVAIRGASGSRTTVYRLSDNGRRLTLDVVMSSEKLGKPLHYTATYVRK